MKYLVLCGRVLFSMIFISSGIFHFGREALRYAESQHIPLAPFLVPASGILAIVGGVSIALGFKTRWGAWLLVLFLVPVTIMMHNFWGMAEGARQDAQFAMFMKNLSLIGTCLMLSWFGGGPLSIDALKRAASAATSRMSFLL